MAQGWMLGSYITGLESSPISLGFAALIALTLPALYIMLGAAWLLSRGHEVVVYERENRFGGHSCTVDVETPVGCLPVDLGHAFLSGPQTIRPGRDGKPSQG